MRSGLFVKLTFMLVLAAHSVRASPLCADWQAQDTVAGSLFAVTNHVDYRMSWAIADHPDRYSEANPLLGSSHPNRQAFANAEVVSLLAYAVGVCLLNPADRHVLEWGAVGFKIGAIISNASLGIAVQF